MLEKYQQSPLPFNIISGIEFQDQAKFNPIKYISKLVNIIEQNNCLIYENTNLL